MIQHLGANHPFIIADQNNLFQVLNRTIDVGKPKQTEFQSAKKWVYQMHEIANHEEVLMRSVGFKDLKKE
jgi:hypothetical protein